MKVKNILLSALICCSYFIDAYKFSTLCFFVSIILIFQKVIQGKKIVKFRNINIYIIIFIYIFVGIIVGIFTNNEMFVLHNFLRDIYYSLNPLILIFLAGVLCDFYTKNDMFNVITISAIFLSICTIFTFTLYVMTNGYTSISDIRSNIFNSSGIMDVLFIGLILFRLYSPKFKFSILITTILSILFIMSRTVILMLLIFLAMKLILCLKQKHRRHSVKKMVIIVGIIFGVMIIYLLFPSMFVDFFAKLSGSLSEISFNHIFSDEFDINSNWRGYEISRAILSFSDFNITNKIFGSGFGYLMPLGITINLNGDLYNAIAILHNGYFTILLKEGIFGLILYFILFLAILRKAFQIKNETKYFIISIVLFLMIASYVVMGIFSATPTIIVLIFVFFFINKGHITMENDFYGK